MSKETSLLKGFMPEFVMQEQTKEQVRVLAAANVQIFRALFVPQDGQQLDRFAGMLSQPKAAPPLHSAGTEDNTLLYLYYNKIRRYSAAIREIRLSCCFQCKDLMLMQRHCSKLFCP